MENHTKYRGVISLCRMQEARTLCALILNHTKRIESTNKCLVVYTCTATPAVGSKHLTVSDIYFRKILHCYASTSQAVAYLEAITSHLGGMKEMTLP